MTNWQPLPADEPYPNTPEEDSWLDNEPLPPIPGEENERPFSDDVYDTIPEMGSEGDYGRGADGNSDYGRVPGGDSDYGRGADGNTDYDLMPEPQYGEGPPENLYGEPPAELEQAYDDDDLPVLRYEDL